MDKLEVPKQYSACITFGAQLRTFIKVQVFSETLCHNVFAFLISLSWLELNTIDSLAFAFQTLETLDFFDSIGHFSIIFVELFLWQDIEIVLEYVDSFITLQCIFHNWIDSLYKHFQCFFFFFSQFYFLNRFNRFQYSVDLFVSIGLGSYCPDFIFALQPYFYDSLFGME